MKLNHELINKLIRHEPFKFSRWGDGEWGCMYGWTGRNRDGNEYLPELRTELLRILASSPKYYMGLQFGVLYNAELRDFVFDKLFKLNIEWCNGDFLHQMSEYGYLNLFVDALKDRNTWIIGADYFNVLPYEHIEIPAENSFHFNSNLLKMSFREPDTVYLVAAAMNSNVIIDKLPDSATAIDIGSVFDPYLGRPRASYQHKLKAEWLW